MNRRPMSEIVIPLRNHWMECRNDYPVQATPTTRVVTGNPRDDAQIEYLEELFGFQLLSVGGIYNLEEYMITDEVKFGFFMMRWS